MLAQKRAGVNIKVLNLSIGGACDVMSEQEKAALKAIAAERVTIVTAAGNEGANNDVVPVCPANLDIPGLVSVGAIDPEGGYAAYSNYGSKVTIAAPGTAIFSTVTKEVTEALKKYYGVDSTSFFMDGTSMAAPMVSGVAALMYSMNPLLTPAEVKKALVDTVKMKSANYQTQSQGLVNAAGAVKRARESVVSGTVTALGQPLSKVTVSMKSSLGTLETVTNENGRFFFVRPPVGVKVALSFSKELYTFPSDVSSPNDAISNPPSFAVSAERETRTVSGNVVVRGAPVSGATVRVTAEFPDKDQFRQETTTDSNGHYSIRVPYKTSYYLFASKGGVTFGNQDVVRFADADQVLKIEGQPKVISIKGSIGLPGGPAMRFTGTAKVTGDVYGKTVTLTAPIRGARFEFYSSELLSGATYTITVTPFNAGFTAPAPVVVTAAGDVSVGLSTSEKR